MLVNNGHLMGTRLFSSIFGGWRLFQPFFLGKLVMGLSNEGIPIKIFKIGDPPFWSLFIEFETSHPKTFPFHKYCRLVSNSMNNGQNGGSPNLKILIGIPSLDNPMTNLPKKNGWNSLQPPEMEL